MANPYPAVFRDDNADTRLAGAIDFTDPANQPGYVQTATVTLADAQIAALPVTYATLVAPSETLDFTVRATAIPMPIAAYAVLSRNAPDTDNYTNVSADVRLLIVGGSDWDASLMFAQASSGRSIFEMLNGQGADRQDQLIPFAYIAASEWPIFNPDWIDNGISVVLDNALGALTGGAATNTLRVVLYYTLVALPA